MDVQMKPELTGPGLQHAHKTQFAAQVFGLGGDVLKSGGALAEEQRVELLLVGLKKSAEFFGKSERDQEVRDGQQFGLLACDPLGGVLMAALGTRFVIAGMISELEVAIVAAISFTAKGRGATRQNGLDGALVRRKNLLTKAP